MRSTLRLPSQSEVQYFRQTRLLAHMHQQLVEQVQQSQEDWKLHFQLANLLAFTDESFYKDHQIDRIKSELHYQQSLILLRQLHQQDYMTYQSHDHVELELPDPSTASFKSLCLPHDNDSYEFELHLSPSSDAVLVSSPHGPPPIRLLQSVSETVADSSSYIVPHDIVKGYTEVFFAYGKYLVLNHRLKEGIHNLLECASWYADSFVDPSRFSSLVLPPQFLLQDSVKKNCINFNSLSKYISRVLRDEQRRLDKQFTHTNMTKYIEEYEEYWDEYNDEMCHLELVVSHPSLRPSLSISSDVSYTSSVEDSKPRHVIEYRVYPQEVQELVTEYEDLCGSYHRFGVLLSDFLRYSDAKREMNRALGIFKKLKIKPQLYDELVSTMRYARNQSMHSPSGRERAQYLAKKLQTPSPRNSQPPSAFDFPCVV
eukprot:297064_1